MNTRVRFSSPVLDDLDIELLKDTFEFEIDNIIETLESAPYEISIIACLIKRLEYKIKTIKKK